MVEVAADHRGVGPVDDSLLKAAPEAKVDTVEGPFGQGAEIEPTGHGGESGGDGAQEGGARHLAEQPVLEIVEIDDGGSERRVPEPGVRVGMAVPDQVVGLRGEPAEVVPRLCPFAPEDPPWPGRVGVAAKDRDRQGC